MGKPVRGVAVLGSTGSVGTQALDVLSGLSERFRVVALAAAQNLSLLRAQSDLFHPKLISCEPRAGDVAPDRFAIETGARLAPMTEIACDPAVDIVLIATSGVAGLPAALAALEAGKVVALANKEILVIAGSLLRKAAAKGGGEIRPVDSEHSAIWQCLWGEQGRPERLILTASGGALRDCSLSELQSVTPEQALRHPTWRMGPKITIDSATLLNKGLETIEARWLFDVPLPQIEVVLHRESIVHSLVELADGSVKAQLGYPDMRLPIQCALTYPERLPVDRASRLELARVGRLNFDEIDLSRFPCLGLAMEAGRLGGTYPAALVAADDVAVEGFLSGRLGFMDIPRLIDAVLARHDSVAEPTIEQVHAAGSAARAAAAGWSTSRGEQPPVHLTV
jgi:1-deoxy-D-xylulose-5-phosphate reductoisomerase